MPRISLEPFRRALIVEAPDPQLDGWLNQLGIETRRLDAVPDEATLASAIQEFGAEVLFKRSRVPVTRSLIEACPGLHAVQLCCIGSDSVDLDACADHGVLVFNDPVSNGRSVVELAVAHLIALSRRLYETDVQMHQNNWDKSASGRYEVLGKRLGIVGLGNIGRQVARVAEALGMEVAFFDNRMVAQEIGVEMGWTRAASLEELFAQADMISVHTSARDTFGNDNANLLDPFLHRLGEERGKSSPRIFLNLARGNVHSAEALLDAVRRGAVRYAAVDVYPEEPAPGAPAWQNPYAEEPRVVCSPHIGAATQEAQPRIARRVADTIGAFSRYGTLRDCVFDPRAVLSVGDQARGNVFLAVVHSTRRGTKKAIDDAIYGAEANNLFSTHQDFESGVAYDLSVMDRPLSEAEIERLVRNATEISGDPEAVRAVRQVRVPRGGWR